MTLNIQKSHSNVNQAKLLFSLEMRGLKPQHARRLPAPGDLDAIRFNANRESCGSESLSEGGRAPLRHSLPPAAALSGSEWPVPSNHCSSCLLSRWVKPRDPPRAAVAGIQIGTGTSVDSGRAQSLREKVRGPAASHRSRFAAGPHVQPGERTRWTSDSGGNQTLGSGLSGPATADDVTALVDR